MCTFCAPGVRAEGVSETVTLGRDSSVDPEGQVPAVRDRLEAAPLAQIPEGLKEQHLRSRVLVPVFVTFVILQQWGSRLKYKRIQIQA